MLSQASTSPAGTERCPSPWSSSLQSKASRKSASEGTWRRASWATKGSLEAATPPRRTSWAAGRRATVVEAAVGLPTESLQGSAGFVEGEVVEATPTPSAPSSPSTPAAASSASGASGQRRFSWRAAAKAVPKLPRVARSEFGEAKSAEASTVASPTSDCLNDSGGGAAGSGAGSLAAALRARKQRSSQDDLVDPSGIANAEAAVARPSKLPEGVMESSPHVTPASSISNAAHFLIASPEQDVQGQDSNVEPQAAGCVETETASENDSVCSGSETFEDRAAEAQVDDMTTRLNQLIAAISQATGFEISISSGAEAGAYEVVASPRKRDGMAEGDSSGRQLFSRDSHEHHSEDTEDLIGDGTDSGPGQIESGADSRSGGSKSGPSQPPTLGRVNSEKVLKMLNIITSNIAAAELEDTCEPNSSGLLAGSLLGDSLSSYDGERQRRASAPPPGASEPSSSMRRVSARQPMQRQSQDLILRLREQEAENTRLVEQLERLRADMDVLGTENASLQVHSSELHRQHQEELSILRVSLDKKTQLAEQLSREKSSLECCQPERGSSTLRDSVQKLRQSSSTQRTSPENSTPVELARLQRENTILRSQLQAAEELRDKLAKSDRPGLSRAGDENLRLSLAHLQQEKHALELQNSDLEARLQEQELKAMNSPTGQVMYEAIMKGLDKVPERRELREECDTLKVADGDQREENQQSSDELSGGPPSPEKGSFGFKTPERKHGVILKDAMETIFSGGQFPEDLLKVNVKEIHELDQLHEFAAALQHENQKLRGQVGEVAKLHDWLQRADPDTPGRDDESLLQSTRNLDSSFLQEELARSHESAHAELVEYRDLLESLRAQNKRLEAEHVEDQQTEAHMGERHCRELVNVRAEERERYAWDLERMLEEEERRCNQELAELRVEEQRHHVQELKTFRDEEQKCIEHARHCEEEQRRFAEELADLHVQELASLRDEEQRCIQLTKYCEEEQQRRAQEFADLLEKERIRHGLEFAELCQEEQHCHAQQFTAFREEESAVSERHSREVEQLFAELQSLKSRDLAFGVQGEVIERQSSAESVKSPREKWGQRRKNANDANAEADEEHLLEIEKRNNHELERALEELQDAYRNLETEEQSLRKETCRLDAEEQRVLSLWRGSEAHASLQDATVQALRDEECRLAARETVYQTLASELKDERNSGAPLLNGRRRSREVREEEFLDLTDEIKLIRKERQKVVKYSDEMQQSLQAKDSELMRLGADVEKLQCEKQVFELKFEHEESLLRTHVDELSDLSNRFQSEEQTFERRHELSCVKFCSEKSALEARYTEIRQELADLSGRFSAQEKELVECHQASLSAMSCKKSTLESEYAELRQAFRDQSEQFLSLEQESFERHSANLQSFQGEKTELEAQCAELKTALERDHVRFAARLTSLTQRHSDAFSAVCNEKAQVKAEHEELLKVSLMEQDLANRNADALCTVQAEKAELEVEHAEFRHLHSQELAQLREILTHARTEMSCMAARLENARRKEDAEQKEKELLARERRDSELAEAALRSSQQRELLELRETHSKLLEENCRLADRLRAESSQPDSISPILAAEPLSAIMSLSGDSHEGGSNADADKTILVDEEPWPTTARPDRLVLEVLERLGAMQKLRAAGRHLSCSRSASSFGSQDSQRVAALHIHIYMRREECNNLSGTFTYVFV